MMRALISQLGAGRFLGHPVHLMLVHFPAGLFPLAFVLDTLAFFKGDSSLAIGSLYALGGGVLGGIAAALFGAIDYFRLPATHPAWRKASLHAGLNLVWLSGFAALFALKWKHYPEVPVPATGQVITSALLVTGMMISNYIGGELLLRYGVGMVTRTNDVHSPPLQIVMKERP